MDTKPTKIPALHSLTLSSRRSCLPGRQIDFLAVHCSQHFSKKVINWRSTWMQNYLSPVVVPRSRWESVPGCPHIPWHCPCQPWGPQAHCQVPSWGGWNTEILWLSRHTPGLRKLATWVNVRGSCTYYIPIIFWQTFPSIMRYRKRGSAL